MKIKNKKINKFGKVLFILFGSALLISPIFLTNINKQNNNYSVNFGYTHNQLNDYNLVQEAWTMDNTIIAKDTAGDVWSWGLGNFGQTGDGDTAINPLPEQITQFNKDNTIVDAWTMTDTIIAKDTAENVWSWGWGNSGQTGNGQVDNDSPQRITQFDGTNTIDEAWTMDNTIIAKDTAGDIWSWGEGDNGQTGNGDTAINTTPERVAQFSSTNTIVDAWTMSNTIIVKDEVDNVWSWGSGSWGQNGDGDQSNNESPEQITQFNSTNTIVDAWTMDNTIIAKDSNDIIWSWGYGNNGQNGDGDTTNNNTSPEQITQFDTNTIVDAWTMNDSIIAKDAVGEIWAWGYGLDGQNGDGNEMSYDTPTRITQFDNTNTIEEAWTMDHTIVAKDTTGNVWSWGQGSNGQTGDGDTTINPSPEQITQFDNSNTIVDAWTMGNTIVAKDSNNVIWSWGNGIVGQNGDGNLTDNPSPERIFAALNGGSIEFENITSSTAIVKVGQFSNGVGSHEATKATLTYGVSGGTDQIMDDDDLTDGVSFDLANLTPSSTYDLSVQYFKDATPIGTPVTSTLTTEDISLTLGNITSSNISSSTATVTVEGFTNGTGNQEATKAILTYGITGGTDMTEDDNDLTDGISFDLANLTPSSTYNISVEYYKDNTLIGTTAASTLTTEDGLLTAGNITASNISSTTATVTVENFINGTGDNEATKATLTYGIEGGTDMTIDDTNLTDGISFNLTNLTEGQSYNLSISYFNASDSQIGAPIISESPLVPQNPPKSGLSTGAIIGISVGVGGAVLIGGGVGGFFLHKNKKKDKKGT